MVGSEMVGTGFGWIAFMKFINEFIRMGDVQSRCPLIFSICTFVT